MKKLFMMVLSLACIATMTCKAQDNILTDAEVAEGWTLLFDGKTMNGWQTVSEGKLPEKSWKVKDGVIIIQKAVRGVRSEGDIVTVNQYSNFELKVDFELTEAANSGIKYLINIIDGQVVGPEFQVLDNEKHPDAKMGINGNRTCGSLYDLIPADPIQTIQPGGFHTAHIIVKGNHVEHWLDGVKLLEYERNTQAFDALVAYSKYAKNAGVFGDAKEGHILLQYHQDEVHYKNIKIREL